MHRIGRLLTLVLLLSPAFAFAAATEPAAPLPAALTMVQSCPNFTALPAGIPEPVPMSCTAPPNCGDPEGYCECRAAGYGIGYCFRGLCS